MKVLQDIAKLTQEEAKDQLLKSVEQDITSEKAALIRDLTQKAKDEALKNSKNILQSKQKNLKKNGIIMKLLVVFKRYGI